MKELTNFQLSIQKGGTIVLALVFFVLALYILQFDPFGFGATLSWGIAAIMLFSAGYLHSLDILISIEDLLDKRIEGINRGLRKVKSDFTSTVKTLEFMYNSNGVSKVDVHSESLKQVEDVVSGSVRMKTVPNFLSGDSTAIMMEGTKDSELKNHSHEEKVIYFLANGEAAASKRDTQTKVLKRGDVLKVKPQEERKIVFRADSVLFAVYVPALEENEEV